MKRCELLPTDRTKLKSYIGFALRKRAVAFGVDNILSSNVKAVLIDGGLKENSRKKLANKLSDARIYELNDIGELVNNPAVKAVGITDKELTKAIEDMLTKY